MIDTPHVTHYDEQATAVIRLTVPKAEMRTVMGPGLEELLAAVADQNLEQVGPWFSHHLRIDPEVFDFEIGVPVASPARPSGRVIPGRLRAARIARTVYRGPYEGLAGAWQDFDRWITANGHKPAPNLWECYVAGPESGLDPNGWKTELNRPLAE